MRPAALLYHKTPLLQFHSEAVIAGAHSAHLPVGATHRGGRTHRDCEFDGADLVRIRFPFDPYLPVRGTGIRLHELESSARVGIYDECLVSGTGFPYSGSIAVEPVAYGAI